MSAGGTALLPPWGLDTSKARALLAERPHHCWTHMAALGDFHGWLTLILLYSPGWLSAPEHLEHATVTGNTPVKNVEQEGKWTPSTHQWDKNNTNSWSTFSPRGLIWRLTSAWEVVLSWLERLQAPLSQATTSNITPLKNMLALWRNEITHHMLLDCKTVKDSNPILFIPKWF